MMSQNAGDATHPVGPELLGRLLDRHAAALELYAAQWCDCPEDVLQEVLLELVRRGQVPENPAAWLFRAVRYRAINAGRSRRRRQHHEAAAARNRSLVLVAPPDEPLPAEEVAAAIAGLPEDEREVVVARLWGELTFREIGQVTGTSESTAHRRYQEALARLRERIGHPSCVQTNET
jgi:RNA polymerase sigma-70 factor (ECF subfamily)